MKQNKKLFSKHILKESVKNNWKLWLAMTALLCFFTTVLTLALSGMSSSENPNNPMSGGILSMYSMMLFGVQGILITLLYAVITGNKLVASEIDRGTMSFTLNTPTTRKQIIFSKALFYIGSIISMIVLMGLFGTVICLATGADMNYEKLWLLVLGMILLIFALSSICFAASCWFNKGSQSMLLGAGIPVVMWLLNMLAEPSLNLEFLKYFSINSLFNTSAVIGGGVFWWQFMVLGVIGVALYSVGIFKFLKKDLPL